MRAGLIACLLLSCTGPALADGLADYQRMVGAAMKHVRFAQFYSQTGNLAVAGTELDQAVEKWTKLQKRFVSAPPARLASDAQFKTDLATVSLLLKQALGAVDKDDGGAAAVHLKPIAARLASLRKRNRLWVFSDCVAGMNQAMAAAWVYRRTAPNFTDQKQVAIMNRRFGNLERWYKRCYREAGQVERQNPAFKRLFDGSLASIARLRRAAADKSGARIISNLRELKSFDRLIWLHLG